MTGNWLYTTWMVWIFLGFLLAFVLLALLGYWLGRRASAAQPESESDSGFNTVLGAMLGMLALLLAFTFAMAADRYDDRRRLVLAEANAIGTSALRAQLLPAAESAAASRLLRDYVASRLEFYFAGNDQARYSAALEQTTQIQDALWQQAVSASAQDPRAVSTGLFVDSLNQVIDLHTERLTAFRNHVPLTIIYLLFIVTCITLAMIGYGVGTSKRHNLLQALLAALLIATILAVIIDLDNSRGGLIRISQQPMIELQQSLEK
jgi:hypothetical protein